MKFTLSWLRDHLETDASLEEIADKLTAIGLEVEQVEDRSAELSAFTVGHVVSAERHPNADKLSVCTVDTGSETVQVVCGAPNAHTGMKGVFAPVGAVIPSTGTVLKKGVIRGVESNGMLCSEREMGLSDEHQGIIELSPDAPIGAPFAAVAGLDDPLIEIGLTPDRADCAGVRGIARDLAAAGLGEFKPLSERPVNAAFASPVGITIDESAHEACPLFVGRTIRGVRNGESPKWLKDRLLSIGLRPISALVDITNFFTVDRARPLHVFDAAKLNGDITVRLSRAGETLEALNDKTYTLDDAMTVIADAGGPVALGGVIGGAPTGVSEETVDVVLEVAYFDRLRTAETGRKLAIDSDARYRFERGVDPAAVIPRTEQATRMILDLCGGEASELVVAGAEPDWRRTVVLRPHRVQGLGGLSLPMDRQAGILMALGCQVRDSEEGHLRVGIPSWRGDIEGEADLVEEILRIEGFDAIPAVPLPSATALTQPAVTPKQKRTEVARRRLASRGLNEAVTWSFLARDKASRFGFANERLCIANPISSDLDVMRPSILPNLIDAAGRNQARGLANTALFEIGPIYSDSTPDGQHLSAAGLRSGLAQSRHWDQTARPVDAYDAKADALAALEAAGAPTDSLQITADAPGWYHPGRSASFRLGPTVLATFGELHPEMLAAFDVSGPMVVFEIDLDRVPMPKRKAGTARPPLKLSAFQPVQRDFAFVVDEAVPVEKVMRAVRAGDKALVVDAGVFDIYRGDGLADGRKSVAISVTLQPVEATLTEADIEAVSKRIVANVEKQTGGTLRG